MQKDLDKSRPTVHDAQREVESFTMVSRFRLFVLERTENQRRIRALEAQAEESRQEVQELRIKVRDLHQLMLQLELETESELEHEE